MAEVISCISGLECCKTYLLPLLFTILLATICLFLILTLLIFQSKKKIKTIRALQKIGIIFGIIWIGVLIGVTAWVWLY